MNWRIKGTIQKVLGVLPGGHRVHFLLQRRGGGLADFDGECDSKVEDWRLMAGHLATARVPLRGATLLEMGTGWYPTFPLCLYLAGARRVLTLDLSRHLDAGLTRRLVERLAVHLPLVAQVAGLEEAEVAARHARLLEGVRNDLPLDELTGGVVAYQAPADAAATGLPAGSVDVVFSNSVLEHVPPAVIDACLVEAQRILRPGGVVFHSVNCGDHYAYADRSVHQLQYLRYSEAAWRRWNNAFLYQNRLRAVDFTEMARRAGFEIEIDTSWARPERLAQLDAMKVDPCFSRYTREQLCITTIDFVGRKPAVATATAAPRT